MTTPANKLESQQARNPAEYDEDNQRTGISQLEHTAVFLVL